MTDPYRVSDSAAPVRGTSAPARQRALRVLLWGILIPAAGANAALSITGRTIPSLAFGVVTTLCVVGLVVSHVKGRRR